MEETFKKCIKCYENIIIERDYISLEEVVNRFDKKEFELPDYQRDYKWSLKNKSELIESLFLNLPLPSVFLIKKNKYHIIDGQQRLKTINNYFNNLFKLEGLETLKELNLKSYNMLIPKLQYLLKQKGINTITIHLEENDDIDIETLLFHRLNTGGMELTSTEIRFARFYKSKFVNVINTIIDKLKYKEKRKNGNLIKTIEINNIIYRIKSNLDIRDVILSYFSILKYKNFDENNLNNILINNMIISEEEIKNKVDNFINVLKKIDKFIGLKSLTNGKSNMLLLIKYDVYMQSFNILKINEPNNNKINKLNNSDIDKLSGLFSSNNKLLSRNSENILKLEEKVSTFLNKVIKND